MSRSIEIREVRDEELDQVGALTLTSYDALTAFSADYRAELGDARIRAATDARIMVGLLDGDVVGSLALSLGETAMFEYRFGIDGDCGFRMLAVLPRAEGHGVGRALVQDAVRQCREAGRHRMVITSMSFMARAHDLYGKLGFVRRPELDVRFPSGVGMTYTFDLVSDADRHFPPPGPVPPEPPWYLDKQ